MAPARSLAARLATVGMAYLAVGVVSIALTLWVTWQLEGGAAAVNEAGRLRMLTYRLTLDASAGRQSDIAAQAAAFERTLELLRDGDPSRPLFVPSSDQTRAEMANVRAAWSRQRDALASHGSAVDLDRAVALVASVDKLVAAIEQRLDYWTSLLRAFELAMLALAVAGVVALLYMSHAMVLEPLRRVGAAIAAVRRGDLQTRVPALPTTEFQDLADGFNAMAERLQTQYTDLEDTVRAKTSDLLAERERLAALYEISAFVARSDSLDDMARGFVAKVRRIARADGVALRWSDAENKRYLMLAQEGLPPTFATQEQCLPTGQCHCGRPPDAARSAVIPIRAEQAALDHCGKAGFQTLLAVPVTLHGRVYGEVDLFFRVPLPQTDPIRSLVELLASHLAGGMQGLLAAAADKEAAVANERGLLAQELHDSIAQSLAFLKIQVQLLRSALTKQDRAAVMKTVDEIETGVMDSYGDVRELLVHFRTRTDAEEIEPALRTTLHKFHNQTGIATDIEVSGHGVALPNDVQVQVLHVVQEALSNIRKHAHASAVTLRVQQAPSWRFDVTDDGLGFDTQGSVDDSHVGLRIMSERARRIGAELSVTSQRGRGTTVSLSLAQPVSSMELAHAVAH
jgi:two-component system nitrate/nitrite sensor histidine kinase NarX